MDAAGMPLGSLAAINRLEPAEKEAVYIRLLPLRLCELLGMAPDTGTTASGARLVNIIAPEGLPLVRMEVRARPDDEDTVFFLELSDTQFRQMELCFCIVSDPGAERFDVDRDEQGRINWFASHGRNIPEEVRAMRSGLFPNQTRRGLGLFADLFPLLERFVDSLGMEMIVAEPLTYDNAIRYETYGFDYLQGRRLMLEIDREFRPGGRYFTRLDGSTPFRMPGMERTVRGRSWAIHDGIMDEPWDEVRIYKMIGRHAGITTFPGREQEQR
ncbi:MAG TPA: hypothetical protein VF799_12420 [Geobacteraceae bacterium]